MAPFKLSNAAIEALLTAGIAAPSADNHLRVRFALSGDTIRMHAAPAETRDLPLHQQAFFEFSCGAVIENMVLAGSTQGLTCNVEPESNWREKGRVATLRFSPLSSYPLDPLAEAIFARHTNRDFYRRSALGIDALRSLSAAAAPYGNVQWCDTQARRRVALKLIWLAESERFRRRALHAELFESIRFDDGWGHASEQGLAPGALGVEPPLRGPFKALRSWPLQRFVNHLGAAPILGLRAGAVPAWMASDIGLFCVSHGSNSWIEAGRGFQRLWLAATRAHIALQPFAASVALTQQKAEDGWARPEIQARLKKGLAALTDEMMAVMPFRIGIAQAPQVTSGRPGIRTFILQNDPPEPDSSG